ncbi:ankyrin repeat domain-containing protein [Planctomycetota bacterium]
MTIGRKLIVLQLVVGSGLILSGCASSPEFTPEFRRAVVNGDVSAINAQLAENPELVNACDKERRTPLHEAVNPTGLSGTYIEAREEREIDGEVKTVVTLRQQPESTKVLIGQGANVNAKDKWGSSPLLEAADYGRVECAKLLVENGADVNARDRDGKTLLYRTCCQHSSKRADQHKEIAELLINNGADVNYRGHFGLTILHELADSWYGINSVDTEIAQLLIEHGADVDARARLDAIYRLQFWYLIEGRGATALHLAACAGDKNMVELLIAKGADVNLKAGYGNTALHLAVSANHLDVVKVLVEAGADVNAKADRVMIYRTDMPGGPFLVTTEDGDAIPKSVLGITESANNEEIAAYLREHGATE